MHTSLIKICSKNPGIQLYPKDNILRRKKVEWRYLKIFYNGISISLNPSNVYKANEACLQLFLLPFMHQNNYEMNKIDFFERLAF